MKHSCLSRMYAWSTLLLISVTPSAAQPWSYDFGSGNALHTTGISTSFLPPPPSGNTRVRIGTQGGSARLADPGSPLLGSGSEAVLTAPTGSSLNKMQWYDFNGTRLFTLQARIIIGGGPGDTYFFCGNGSCFSDNVGFSSSQIFTGLRWRRDSSGLQLAIRDGSGWTAATPSSFPADSMHLLEIYANNSSNSNTYVHGSSQTLPPFSCDVWVDDSLLFDNLPGAGLADSLDIDSFMFYMSASPANDTQLLLDDITYTSSIAGQPLPVELTAFEARLHEHGIRLRWRTETEIQNFGFEIQRYSGSGEWQAIGFVAGDGDRYSPRWYDWIDTLRGTTGRCSYRLRQIDRDGGSTLSPECRVEEESARKGLRLGIPWPNPAREYVTIPLHAEIGCSIQIEIISLAGRQAEILSPVRFLPAGAEELRLPCGHLPRGLHLVAVHSGGGMQSRLVLLH